MKIWFWPSKELSKNIFIPFAVGGGLNNLRDVNLAFKNGADKVVLNSYLFGDISILNKISKAMVNNQQ